MPRPLTRILRQLEAVSLHQRSQIDALQAEQRSLRLDAAVAALKCRHLDALVELAALVAAARRARRRSSEGATGTRGAGGTTDAGPFEAVVGQDSEPGSSEFWCTQVRQMAAQLGGPAGSVLQASEPPGAPHAPLPDCLTAPRLGWSPAAVAEWLFSEEDPPQLTVEGCRRAMRDLAMAAAQLMPRIRHGAPNSEAARQRLVALNRRTLEITALLAIGEGRSDHTTHGCSKSGSSGVGSGASRKPAPSPLVEVVLRPLDGSDTPLPDDKFWMWAVEQMRLDPEQEEVLLLLMERWRARSQAVNQRCLALHAEVEARAGMDAAAHDELLSQLAAAQLAFEVNTALFVLATFGSVLQIEQVSDLMVASWPFAPSAHMLHQVLTLRQQQRKEAAAAAAAAAATMAESLPPGQGRPQGEVVKGLL